MMLQLQCWCLPQAEVAVEGGAMREKWLKTRLLQTNVAICRRFSIQPFR
jgi:hypothetical protein